jgi:succinate-acetate transporter protein
MMLMKRRAGFFLQKQNIAKAGGYLGVVTALIAYYCGLAELLTTDDLFTIPLGKHRTD